MRAAGLILLLTGFLWIALLCFQFGAFQYTRSHWHAANSPAGSQVDRDEVVVAMRQLSLELNQQQRRVLFPASLMLAGGLILFFISRRTSLGSGQCGD